MRAWWEFRRIGFVDKLPGTLADFDLAHHSESDSSAKIFLTLSMITQGLVGCPDSSSRLRGEFLNRLPTYPPVHGEQGPPSCSGDLTNTGSICASRSLAFNFSPRSSLSRVSSDGLSLSPDSNRDSYAWSTPASLLNSRLKVFVALVVSLGQC